jgi:hypothetical protein
MSFLYGNLADEPGLNLKGYSTADFCNFSEFENYEGNLYAPAPNDNLAKSIKIKYHPKIKLLQESLKAVEVELLLKCSPSVIIELNGKKQDITDKIESLKKEMFEEFENKGIDYTPEEYLGNFSQPSINNVPDYIVKEYKKHNDPEIINKFKIAEKEKTKMSFEEFKARYFSKDLDLIKQVYNRATTLEEQLNFIKISKEKELENPIFSKEPSEITEGEVMEYLGRKYLDIYEYPIRDTIWLLHYKFNSAFTAELIESEKFKESGKFKETERTNVDPTGKDWKYYRPILRKYYYTYEKYINFDFYINDQTENTDHRIVLKKDISKGTNMEYDLRQEFITTNGISGKYNNAVKWYILDNPEISFGEYLNIFNKTEEYLAKDFFIAKDYIFSNPDIPFKQFKINWVYTDFCYNPVVSETSSEISENSSEIEINDNVISKTLNEIFLKIYNNITKNEFIWGLITGYIIEKSFKN